MIKIEEAVQIGLDEELSDEEVVEYLENLWSIDADSTYQVIYDNADPVEQLTHFYHSLLEGTNPGEEIHVDTFRRFDELEEDVIREYADDREDFLRKTEDLLSGDFEGRDQQWYNDLVEQADRDDELFILVGAAHTIPEIEGNLLNIIEENGHELDVYSLNQFDQNAMDLLFGHHSVEPTYTHS